ncbi:hypothetical protein [Ornithinibacillus scapharcae]|uniref:hypothetical protein n=1 Tax=Ornithinibacillus scapharcae TaxID=1147159 RepID=UPI000225B7F4|nr:hypothetical protein [Ornithinibacillus scapharcae]
MDQFQGTIFQGDLDDRSFYLTQVKNITTASSLSIDQLVKMAAYLEKQEETCTITVNDQIPLLLTNQDIKDLQFDLMGILKHYH